MPYIVFRISYIKETNGISWLNINFSIDRTASAGKLFTYCAMNDLTIREGNSSNKYGVIEQLKDVPSPLKAQAHLHALGASSALCMKTP